MRKPLLILLAVLLVAVLIYPFLGGDPESGPLQPARPYAMAQTLGLVQPPPEAFRPRVFNDPVERVVSRLKWARPDMIYFSQRHLPKDTERLARRVEEELDKQRKGIPLGAKVFVEMLGVIGDRSSEHILLELASSPPDFLQAAAITSLKQFPESPEIDLLLGELSTSKDLQVASAAVQAVLHRDWERESPQQRRDAVKEMLHFYAEEQAVSIIDEVFKRDLRFAAEDLLHHLDSASLDTRHVTIKVLLRFGHPRGEEAAREELTAADDHRILRALRDYRAAEVQLPLDLVRPLVESESVLLRKALADALSPVPEQDPDNRRIAVSLLDLLANDELLGVRRSALQSLLLYGEDSRLEPERERLRSSHGDALKDASSYLCEVLKDPACAPIIRERLKRDTHTVNISNLLFGLRFVAQPTDVDLYVAFLLRAGTEQDRLSGKQVYLSDLAAQYIVTFGRAAVVPLFEALAKASTERARLAIIDALRGVGTELTEQEQDRLVDVAFDDSHSMQVRIAALGSLPFFDDGAVAERVRPRIEAIEERPLRQFFQQMYLCYF